MIFTRQAAGSLWVLGPSSYLSHGEREGKQHDTPTLVIRIPRTFATCCGGCKVSQWVSLTGIASRREKHPPRRSPESSPTCEHHIGHRSGFVTGPRRCFQPLRANVRSGVSALSASFSLEGAGSEMAALSTRQYRGGTCCLGVRRDLPSPSLGSGHCGLHADLRRRILAPGTAHRSRSEDPAAPLRGKAVALPLALSHPSVGTASSTRSPFRFIAGYHSPLQIGGDMFGRTFPAWSVETSTSSMTSEGSGICSQPRKAHINFSASARSYAVTPTPKGMRKSRWPVKLNQYL